MMGGMSLGIGMVDKAKLLRVGFGLYQLFKRHTLGNTSWLYFLIEYKKLITICKCLPMYGYIRMHAIGSLQCYRLLPFDWFFYN